MIDARAGNNHIVTNAETALTAHPLPLSIDQPAVRKNSSLVQLNTSVMELSGPWEFFWVEKIPARFTNNFVRSMAEDVNDGVG
jgi:hypothetical protein